MTEVTLQTLEDLQMARSLLAAGWCKHYLATDRDGHEVPPLDDNAARFCGTGALVRAARTADRYDDARALLPIENCSLPTYNDSLASVHKMLQLYDRAIEAAERILAGPNAALGHRLLPAS